MEAAVAIVVKKLVGKALVEARMAVGANLLDRVATGRLLDRVPVNVIRDKQIKSTVIVVV